MNDATGIDFDQMRKMLEEAGSPRPAVFPTDPLKKTYGIAKDDPMSPYRPEIPQMIFNDIADYINKKGFPAIFPESYTKIHWYFTKFNVDLIHQTEEDNPCSRGMLTIAGMIELTNERQPWSLQHIDDLPIIKFAIEKYRDALAGATKNNKQLQQYLQKVDNFIDLLEHGKAKWYTRLGKQSDTGIDLIKLFKSILRQY